MPQGSNNQTLIAAGIVAVAVIAGNVILGQALNRVTTQLDRTAGRLEEIKVAVADAKDALSNLKVAGAAAPARRGPDPNKRYTVNTKGSPTMGKEGAAITIVEFSDFQ
jgi:protein-disulfide isomerase